MVSFVRKHPFFLITIVFILGITMAPIYSSTASPAVFYTIAGAVVMLALCLQFIRIPGSERLQIFVLLVAFFLLGFCKYLMDTPRYQSDHMVHYVQEGKNHLAGLVSEVTGDRLIISLNQLNSHSCRGKITAFSKEDLKVGDQIAALAYLTEIAKPRNPFGFDFRKYMENKGILFQASFIGKLSVVSQGSTMSSWIAEKRRKAKMLVRKIMSSENEYALTLALVLGYKKDLNAELKHAFAGTGAMHVLAVSGLHVGVVYMLLMFLFKAFFPTGKIWRIIRSSLVLLGLWSFVYLVGAPISAWRAAMMFSLFEIGRLASRGNYAINTLSFAAFILLLINSYSLFDVSFQLSFLAVLGIVTCQRCIQELWTINHWLGFKVWQLTSLSLAAQIFTVPLTIFYFHQFPVYFWLSGLVAVPLAFLLLSSTLIYLVLSWVPLLGMAIGYVSFAFAYLMNSWVFLVQQLPGVTVSGIWISIMEVFLILGMSVFFTIWLNSKRLLYLNFACAILVCLLLLLCEQKIERLQQKVLVFYYDRTAVYVDLFLGDKFYPLLSDESQELPQHIIQTRQGMGTSNRGDIHNQTAVLANEEVVAYRSSVVSLSPSTALLAKKMPQVKYALLSQDIEMGSCKCEQCETTFILSPKVPYGGKYLEERLSALSCGYHNLNSDGYFAIDLNEMQ